MKPKYPDRPRVRRTTVRRHRGRAGRSRSKRQAGLNLNQLHELIRACSTRNMYQLVPLCVKVLDREMRCKKNWRVAFAVLETTGIIPIKEGDFQRSKNAASPSELS